MGLELNTQGACCGVVQTLQPSFLLDFANTNVNPVIGGANLSVARASAGTRRNSRGYLENIGPNAARFEHAFSGARLGLLTEQQRTNVVLWSGDLTDPSWIRVGCLNGTVPIIAPDEMIVARRLIEDTSNGFHYTQQTISGAPNQVWTASFFVAPSGRDRVRLQMFEASGTVSGIYVDANLTAGTVGAPVAFGEGVAGATATIDRYNNNYYRVTLTGQPTTQAGLTTFALQIALLDAAGANSYVGGGNAFAVVPWGVQVELGQFASSYIPTEAAAATRAADLVTSPYSAVMGYAQPGSMLFEGYQPAAYAQTAVLVALANGDNSNRVQMSTAANGNLQAVVTAASVLAQTNTGTTAIPAGLFRAAARFAANDLYAVSAGGNGVQAVAALPSPATFTNLHVGSLNGILVWGGIVSRLAFFNTALSNAELAGLVA